MIASVAAHSMLAHMLIGVFRRAGPTTNTRLSAAPAGAFGPCSAMRAENILFWAKWRPLIDRAAQRPRRRQASGAVVFGSPLSFSLISSVTTSISFGAAAAANHNRHARPTALVRRRLRHNTRRTTQGRRRVPPQPASRDGTIVACGGTQRYRRLPDATGAAVAAVNSPTPVQIELFHLRPDRAESSGQTDKRTTTDGSGSACVFVCMCVCPYCFRAMQILRFLNSYERSPAELRRRREHEEESRNGSQACEASPWKGSSK
jgi:hypothetical protein